MRLILNFKKCVQHCVHKPFYLNNYVQKNSMAERAGFEPAVKLPLHPLSRRAP